MGIHYFLIFALKTQWGGSNVYPQSTFWAKIWKILHFFISNYHHYSREILQYIARTCLRNENMVFATYLKNKDEQDQILYTPYHWQDVHWDCKKYQYIVQKYKNTCQYLACVWEKQVYNSRAINYIATEDWHLQPTLVLKSTRTQ